MGGKLAGEPGQARNVVVDSTRFYAMHFNHEFKRCRDSDIGYRSSWFRGYPQVGTILARLFIGADIFFNERTCVYELHQRNARFNSFNFQIMDIYMVSPSTKKYFIICYV